MVKGRRVVQVTTLEKLKNGLKQKRIKKIFFGRPPRRVRKI